jgi:2Fe-2S ferredoxin
MTARAVARITYVAFDGAARVVDVPPGLSVMEGAVKNNVRGIAAECGGQMACGTCHVHVDRAWFAKTGTRSPDEETMLGFSLNAADNSRLACQIAITEALDGLIVHMPKDQHA